MNYINREGSVDDIKCTLSHINENTQANIERLNDSIVDEKNKQKRSTVIKMLEAKLKKLTKNE